MAVIQQPSMKTALHLVECFKCLDDVKLAMVSYNKNDTSSWKKKSLYRQCSHNKAYRSDVKHIKVLQHKHKMCHSCITYNKSQKAGDNALQLTKAYMTLLDKLDQIEEESLKEIDQDLVKNLVHLNKEMYHINSVLQEQGGTCRYFHKEDEKREALSLDALEKFLGNLMEEAEELERQSNVKDTNKYEMVMPLLTRIGKMISDYPTKQFLSYHEHLGKLEAAIRVSHRGSDDGSTNGHVEVLAGYYSSFENSFRPIQPDEPTSIQDDSMDENDSNFESVSAESDTISSSDLETEV